MKRLGNRSDKIKKTSASRVKVQWNPVNTHTKGACQSVRYIWVSVLSGLLEKRPGHMHVLSIQKLIKTCLRQQNVLYMQQVQTKETLCSFITVSG